MQSIQIEDDSYVPRAPSIRGRRSSSGTFCISPSLLIGGLPRKSFSYNKLPQQSIWLSILKLDGSCYDVEVTATATIVELKQAVERVFSHFPRKGPGKISWSHVWGQFCLSYDSQKLLIDTECIRNYGIKDRDQLYFVRHVSIKDNLIKRRSKKQSTFEKSQDMRGKNGMEKEGNVEEDEDEDYEDLEDPKRRQYFWNEETEQEGEGMKWKGLWRGSTSYTQLPRSSRRNHNHGGVSHSSTLADSLINGLHKLIRIYTDRCCP